MDDLKKYQKIINISYKRIDTLAKASPWMFTDMIFPDERGKTRIKEIKEEKKIVFDILNHKSGIFGYRKLEKEDLEVLFKAINIVLDKNNGRIPLNLLFYNFACFFIKEETSHELFGDDLMIFGVKSHGKKGLIAFSVFYDNYKKFLRELGQKRIENPFLNTLTNNEARRLAEIVKSEIHNEFTFTKILLDSMRNHGVIRYELLFYSGSNKSYKPLLFDTYNIIISKILEWPEEFRQKWGISVSEYHLLTTLLRYYLGIGHYIKLEEILFAYILEMMRRYGSHMALSHYLYFLKKISSFIRAGEVRLVKDKNDILYICDKCFPDFCEPLDVEESLRIIDVIIQESENYTKYGAKYKRTLEKDLDFILEEDGDCCIEDVII